MAANHDEIAAWQMQPYTGPKVDIEPTPLVATLFRVAVISAPFSAIPAIAPLGELSNDLSTYVVLPLLLAFSWAVVAQGASLSTGAVGKLFGALFLAIAASFFMNIVDIADAEFRGRTGVGRVVTTTLVLLFTAALSVVVFRVCSVTWINGLVIRPVCISVLICVLVGALEFASWYSASIGALYAPVSAVIHSAKGWETSIGRIRSVAFEAPFLALFLGFALPWVLLAYRLTRRLPYLVLILAGLVVLFFTNTRTGMVLAAIWLAVDRLSMFWLLRTKLSHVSYIMICSVAMVAVIAVTSYLIAGGSDALSSVLASDNVSNVSRSASIVAALGIFADNPLFGVGFGQYGFYAEQYIPSWGYLSWEINNWLTNPDATWPPTYSMFARIGAELGVLGILAWFGGLLIMSARVARAASNRVGSPADAYLPVCLLSGVALILASSIAFDSFRILGISVFIGVAARYIHDAAALINSRHFRGGHNLTEAA